MYAQDMPPIRDAMRADIDVFKRGVMFAVCSIRQPAINVPDQLGILFDGAEGENPLFGHKFKAWEFLNDPRRVAYLWKKLNFFAALIGPYDGNRGTYPTRASTENALHTLLEVPGLGIVKAAFVLQLMGFDVACLDSRNTKRDGRNSRAFETNSAKKARSAFIAALVSKYLDATFGRAEEYWDAWCVDVAHAYSMTPDEVSALHLAIIPANWVPF